MHDRELGQPESEGVGNDGFVAGCIAENSDVEPSLIECRGAGVRDSVNVNGPSTEAIRQRTERNSLFKVITSIVSAFSPTLLPDRSRLLLLAQNPP